MKKLFLTFFLILVLVALIFFAKLRLSKPLQNEKPEKVVEVTQYEVSITPDKTSEHGTNSSYKSTWLIVRDIDKIMLFSNLTEELTSSEAKEKNSCDSLISGSFYTEDKKHIGLFVSNGTKLNASSINQTFNAFLYISELGKPSISTSEPEGLKIAIQSGPLLLKNKIPQKLSLARDENARRIIASVNDNDQVVFIVIYDKSNTFLGPTLAETGKILEDLNENTALRIKDAINLDGGTHSAFVTNLTKLTEVSLIGSYFCIKP